MSGEASDTYAVVHKSKKYNGGNDGSVSQQLHQDSITDVYAVVDKKRKINPETNIGDYDIITADAVISTDAADTDLYDYASAPVYGKLDRSEIQNESAITIDTEKAACGSTEYSKSKTEKVKCRRYSVLMVIGFFGLISAVVIATIAVAIAFSLIAGLRRSELKSVMKNPELSLDNFKQKLSLLQMEINNFSEKAIHSLESKKENLSENIQILSKGINLTQNMVIDLVKNIRPLEINIKAVEVNFGHSLNFTANNYYVGLEGIKNLVNESITETYDHILAVINKFSDKLASEIQTYHTFNSCEDVSNFPIQLPSGIYNIMAGNFSIGKYCSTIIAFSCHGVLGRWRRIAYLSNNTSSVECPMGFERINDSNVPALCKRNPTGARCSSITYSTHGNSYSQVCGTIHGSYFGDPDGFISYSSIRSKSADTPINGSYVDGISLTHGSMNEHHIWTLSAIVNINNNDISSVCNSNKPSYVGMDYSCDVVGTKKCQTVCSKIWENNTFYKNLTEPTSNDIKMRVCTDQDEGDEDIFLGFVEFYVM